MFYEDSDGDFNVISEDDDLADAKSYAEMKASRKLKCSILSREMFLMIREEQIASANNQSTTWLKKDVYKQS